MTQSAAPVAAILAFAGSYASAQPPGRISGRVLDQTGAPLPSVSIELVVHSQEVTTGFDAAGLYRFENVPAGHAELTYRLLNFSVLRRTVMVGSGAAVKADAVLTLALSADVLVTASGTFRNVADVENPAENLVGIAAAASQGAVTSVQLDARPVMRAGEVLEAIPGLIVSQHSGEGNANQYSSSRCSTSSTRRCRTSTISTCRGFRVNLWRASPILTHIRRCRAPFAWACSCPSRPGGLTNRAGLKTHPYI